jgi:hypothetical protein
MEKQPIDILREGRDILDPVLYQHGFSFSGDFSGAGSGGPYAGGVYSNGDRKLEIHYRYSLGLVTYHFGETSLDHDSYMRALLGKAGGNRYPGFSDDPMAGFRDLAYDLRNFAGAFLSGEFKEFASCAMAAEELKKIPGFVRLP